MRIDGTRGPNEVQRGRERGRSEAGGNVFRLDEGAQASRSAMAGGVTSISGVDALLALQSLDEVGPRAARLKHGNDVLDLLEDIKIGLLGGRIPTTKLEHLVESLGRRPGRDGEDGIERVLDEIELRARVELAKLGREAA